MKSVRCMALLAMAALLLVAAAAAAEHRHALVIGIQNYERLPDLETPLKDAREVARMLEERYGFEVDLLLDASRETALGALFGLRRTEVQEDGSLLVYYAGHGWLDRESGVGYWQPADADPDSVVNWIPLSEVTAVLKAVRVKHALVVADSCYSGTLVRDSGARLPSGMGRQEWLQRMAARRSRTALTSGGEEPVLDSGSDGHSVFAKAFLDVLRENREILDGAGLFDQIKRPVVLNARQTPLYSDIRDAGHAMGDFLLVPMQRSLADVPESAVVQPRSFYSQGRGGGEESAVPAAEPKPGEVRRDESTGLELAWVPGGCFRMGSDPGEEGYEDDEGPAHEVCVDGLWMGRHEVTQGQWQQVMGNNPSKFRKGVDYPVEQVSWDDVQDFVGKLNAKSGRSYRLPTEAEWEHACRSGGKSKYCGGNDLDAVAWHKGNSGDSPHPVGQKAGNSLGLHDMSGNVWEWCSDWYAGDYYARSVRENPRGPAEGLHRVMRGGSFFLSPSRCRSVYRNGCRPGIRDENVGFRLALSPKGPAGGWPAFP